MKLIIALTLTLNTLAADAPKQNPMMQMLPIVLIFLIFYFLMIRPQKKQMDEEKAMIDNLQKDVEVFTKSGLLGTVVGITDKVITLEISKDVKVKVLKSQIGGLSSKIFEKKDS